MRLTRPTVRQVESAVTAAAAAYTLGQTLHQRWRELTAGPTYRIAVESRDPVYADAMAALLTMIPENRQRDLRAGYAPNQHRDRGGPALSVYYAGTTTHTIQLGGHDVEVEVSAPGKLSRKNDRGGVEVTSPDSAEDSFWDHLAPRSLTLTATSVAGRDAALAWLTGLADQRRARRNPPSIHLLTPWGGWDSIGDVGSRPLDSVVLADGILDTIVADVAQFLDARDDYDRFGLPWHRGYLFPGPPGTGKTSLVRALAGHFNLDLWYMPLSDIPSDTDVLRQISQIRGGILLLEDVDVFRSTADRDATAAASITESMAAAPAAGSRDQLTLSGVLNALDGVATPPGLVTMMTTNHPERLDSALVRSGRVDMRVELGLIESPDHARRLVHALYGDTIGRSNDVGLRWEKLVGLAPADVVGACKPHMGDPEQALIALGQLSCSRPTRAGHDHGGF